MPDLQRVETEEAYGAVVRAGNRAYRVMFS